MRKAAFITPHTEFVNWVLWYGDFLQRAVEAKRVVRTRFEKRELVEALVLRCAVRWEVLVTQDIIASLNRDSSAYATALGLRLRKHLSNDECKAMFMGHRYVDFRSVDDVRGFGRKYLVAKHNPFAGLTNPLCKKIDEFLIMRNVLAHYSDYAWRPYQHFLRTRYGYERVLEPGSFLIAVTAAGEYRWSEYLRAFLEASGKMLKCVT
jgi:hypothetical protein